MNTISNNVYSFYNKNLNLSFGQNKVKETDSSIKDDAEKIERIGKGFEKKAPFLYELSCNQNKEASNVLYNAFQLMFDIGITGNKPINKELYDDSGNLAFKISSYCCGSKSDGSRMGVNYLYATVVKEYYKNGNVKKSTEFSRLPSTSEHDYHTRQKYTSKPFVQYIKEYDEHGNLVRKIEGHAENILDIDAIELYDGKEKLRFNYNKGRVSNIQEGDFSIEGNVLNCPVMFKFDGEKLDKVEKNKKYYGFHVANCEVFKYDDGHFKSYEKIGR